MEFLGKGDLGEAIFIVEAARRDYPVFKPLTNNLRYDFVVERNGKLEKIQVKSVPKKNGVLEVPTKTVAYSPKQKGTNRNRNLKYKLGDFDWLVAVDLDDNKCYFIPAYLVIERRAFTLRIDPPKRKRNNIRYAKDYLKW